MTKSPDKVALLTGALGALGRATAPVLTEAGYTVVHVGRSARDGDDTDALDEGLVLPSVDLADPVAACGVVAQVLDQLGRIDLLVNAAGRFVWTKVADTQPDAWRSLYRDNLETALSMSLAVLPVMTQAGCGRIVNVGAMAAHRADAGMGPYTAAKAAVLRLTEALAAEHKDQGITVNAVLPAILDTPANRHDMPDADFNRWVSPRDAANVIAFLASPEARAINGAGIPVTARL